MGQDAGFARDEAYPQGQSVGLVLSGGGAKGIAHVGVIQALEENGIPIDFVAGTSMGAIVGGLYASGYTPDEMMALLMSKEFSYWSTGQIDPQYAYYFAADQASPVMFSINMGPKKDSLQQAKTAVPASLINPMPMSFAFMELFSGHTAQCGGDFNRLFVPFRCVASDAAAKHKVVLSRGDLGQSIRASMSFPLVFQATEVDSMLLYDGGIYDNFPVDVMKEDFAPDFILGVDVSTEDTGPQTSLMDQLENLVIQNNDYYLDPADGIKLRIDLNEFSLLDFPKAKQIYDIGYARGMEMIDSIKSRVYSRVPAEARQLKRQVFKSQTPYINFGEVVAFGGTPKQNTYIKYMFGGDDAATDTLTIDQARRDYYRAISTGKFRDLAPRSEYNDTTGLFLLRLKTAVKDQYSLGIGGYISSSTSSYVYVSGGYSTLSFRSVSANAGAWLGQSYLGAMLTSRLFLRTQLPSAIELQAVVFRQRYYDKDYLFYERKEPSYLVSHELYGRLKWACAAGTHGSIDAGAGYGTLNDGFFRPIAFDEAEYGRDHSKYRLGQAFVNYNSSTLDDINFPTQGGYCKITAMGVIGRYTLDYANPALRDMESDPKWLQIEAQTRNYFTLSRKFALGVETDALLSTRKAYGDYSSAMAGAPAFHPTPSSYNTFNPGLRAYSFIAAGLAPIYKYSDNLSARLAAYAFAPIRKITSDAGMAALSRKWLGNPQAFCEFDICYKLPFATVCAYCNYTSSSGTKWNVGVSFGVFLPAPSYLR
ncbi:MAG: patatin-like phospholipase family protein [Clostridium sp.]|nr:patatin-like phospholipase family protein [Clostridium sp.]